MKYPPLTRATLAVLGMSALLVLPAPPAAAQEGELFPVPLVELSAGYTFMRDFSATQDLTPFFSVEDNVDFPAGWYVSPAVNATRWLAVVGEATGSYKNNFKVELGDLVFPSDVRVYTFMAGPRFFYKTGRFLPYGQFLAGAAHARLKATMPSEFALVGTVKDSTTEFALQPGGGVTVFLTDRVGVRLAADYRRIIVDLEEGMSADEFRILTGFTFNWGRR